MKLFQQWAFVVAAAIVPALVSGRGISAFAGSLRGRLDGRDSTQNVAPAPPSCQVFDEMLGRVYYIRDQLAKTTLGLNSMGYPVDHEWFMDQGIGSVTPASIASVVCPLLANTSKPVLSLLARHIQPGGPPPPSNEQKTEPPKEPTLAESYLPKLPDWVSGKSSEQPKTQQSAVDGSQNRTDNASGPALNHTELPFAENASLAPVAPEATPMELGCPAGSLQNYMLANLQRGFEARTIDSEALASNKAMFEDMALNIENGVVALYKYRGCPSEDEHEFKTRYVCQVSRDTQAKALKMQQNDIPEVRFKLFSLQSRLKQIDSGASKECLVVEASEQDPHSVPKDLSWCLRTGAIVDALLDGRKAQKQWLKGIGDGLQQLKTVSMQLNDRIKNPVLRQDKIPLNALKSLAKTWKELDSRTETLRTMGSTRAKQAVNIDAFVLQLSGLLKNVSTEEKCASENFRMRYSARSCSSLRIQLNAAAEARRSDVQALQQSADKMLKSSSADLIANKCTAPPMTQGCWVRLPSGCPNLPAWKSADKWTRDVFGEQSTGAAASEQVCTVSRKIQLNNLCGATNAEMKFIPASSKP